MHEKNRTKFLVKIAAYKNMEKKKNATTASSGA